MRSKLLSALTVLGAVTVLVLAANTVALAANGKGFLLGKTNSASKVTTLTRTVSGPALQVKTKSNLNAPFAVNGTGKVANLNADKIDGKDSSAFAPSTVTAKLPVAYGYINGGSGGTNPSIEPGSVGISNVSWDSGNGRYVITFTGRPYDYNDFATQITGTCGNLVPRTDSVGNNLIVAFNSSSPCVTGGFALVSYKLH